MYLPQGVTLNYLLWWKIHLARSSDIVFQLQVIYKSCRQVLTPVNNSQLLLELEILDKLRLVTLHTTAAQRNCNIITGWYQFRRNESSHDLDSQSVKMNTLIAWMILSMLLSFDILLLLCDTISLSHYVMVRKTPISQKYHLKTIVNQKFIQFCSVSFNLLMSNFSFAPVTNFKVRIC